MGKVRGEKLGKLRVREQIRTQRPTRTSRSSRERRGDVGDVKVVTGAPRGDRRRERCSRTGASAGSWVRGPATAGWFGCRRHPPRERRHRGDWPTMSLGCRRWAGGAMLGRSPTEMHWAGSMPWPEEGLTHPKWLVSVVARQVAHYRKNGFVQTWPRVGRCPNDRAGLLWLSTAVGRFDAPGRKWAIVLGDLVLGVGWREGGMMAREG